MTPEPTPETWLTVEDAARRIQASRRSVYRAIKAGELKAAKINGRGDLRIAASWIDEWLSQQARRAE